MPPIESSHQPSPDLGESDSAATVSSLASATASRRTVLKGAAATGVTAATAGIVADILFAGPASAATTESGERAADGHDLVAHVRNVRKGEIDLYVGTRQVTVHDKSLAARIARAAR